MDRFLILVLTLCLGSAYYAGIVRRDAPEAAQASDGANFITSILSQFIIPASGNQASQTNEIGGTPDFNPDVAASYLQNMFRSILPNNGSKTMDYDLSQAIQMLNASAGIPQVAENVDTSKMTRSEYLDYIQKQTNSYSNLINAEMTKLLEPKRVAKYFNISSQFYDPSENKQVMGHLMVIDHQFTLPINNRNSKEIADGLPAYGWVKWNTSYNTGVFFKIANNLEAQETLRKEYEELVADYQKSVRESINERNKSNTTADPVQSGAMLELLQNQMANMATMYNRELSNALKTEDTRAPGDAQQLNTMSMNLEKAIMNIFQNISQGQGPFNTPLKWDSKH